ncbi:MAG TPA: hypothetical protein VLI54_06890 [Bacillota bacterium]|nr:hypothetical protein [Bacillota bacterium]
MKPAILLPNDVYAHGGLESSRFSYSNYEAALANAQLVARVTFRTLTEGAVICDAFGGAVQYSNPLHGTEDGGRLHKAGNTQLVLGRTGNLAVMHAALLIPDGDIQDGRQRCKLPDPTEWYQDIALATIVWPDAPTAHSAPDSRAAQSVTVLARRFIDVLPFYSHSA